MSGDAGTTTETDPRRVIQPGRRFIPRPAEQEEEMSRLLSKMDSLYREAYRRIAEEDPQIVARLLVSGVFVGLLDPFSNIMVNSVFTSEEETHIDIVDDLEATLGEMVRRSLDGLVAFLLYFFPYLPRWQAVRYLLVADADLLVAARLIVADRSMTGFSITSPASMEAFMPALRLGAQLAGHPSPEGLVRAWVDMDSRPGLLKAWALAASRPPYINNVATMPYQSTRSLRMALFDTFRCFYLRALARLPRQELRTRYHRSMLKGGHCYGPMMDPVSNIILNTLWYDATFSGGERPVLDMIGPGSLTRLECRSFYGLASFIQTRYHNLSEHEITQCLAASGACLSLADPNLDPDASTAAHLSLADINLNADRAVWEEVAAWRRRRQCMTSYNNATNNLQQQSPCTSTQQACEAAATAARHPNPEEHAAFLSSCKAIPQRYSALLLQSGHRLTSEDVQCCLSLPDPNLDFEAATDTHLSWEEAAWQRRQCMTSYNNATNKLQQQSPCASTQQAYEAAATAARHPNPEAQAAFLSSCKAMLPRSAALLLQSGHPLTSEDVQYITSVLSPKQPTPEPIRKKNPYPVKVGKRRSEYQQRRITAKVKAALDRHFLRDGEPMYDLHIICGANEYVGSPEYGEDEEDYLPCAPCTFPYSHVNFLVTQKGSESAPMLYFAEFQNGRMEDQPSFCCRVDVPTPFAEHVRCLYCESEGAKIVHPASVKFHGRDTELEDLISGRGISKMIGSTVGANVLLRGSMDSKKISCTVMSSASLRCCAAEANFEVYNAVIDLKGFDQKIQS